MSGHDPLLHGRTAEIQIAVHIYICIFPHDVAESSQKMQAHARILMQDPTNADEQDQSLVNQIVSIFHMSWNKQNTADELCMHKN